MPGTQCVKCGENCVCPLETQISNAPEFPKIPNRKILSFISSGGMGAVYKAKHEILDRIEAIKILRSDLTFSFVDRFKREVKLLSLLSHPNIVAVHEAGTTGENLFLSMEYVDGTSLHEIIDEIDALYATKVVRDVARGLLHAHEKGILHRDVKPMNILIGQDKTVKIADFGLACWIDRKQESKAMTAAGQVLGTPGFMAPEQFGNPLGVDARADVFALGVTFYVALTKKMPQWPISIEPFLKFHPRLERVLIKMLNQAPETRYASMADIIAELDMMLALQNKSVRAEKTIPIEAPKTQISAIQIEPPAERSYFWPIIISLLLFCAILAWTTPKEQETFVEVPSATQTLVGQVSSFDHQNIPVTDQSFLISGLVTAWANGNRVFAIAKSNENMLAVLDYSEKPRLEGFAIPEDLRCISGNENTIYIGTSDSLIVLDYASKRIKDKYKLPDTPILIRCGKSVFIGYEKGDVGILNEGRLKHIKLPRVIDIAPLDTDKFLAATDRGIIREDGRNYCPGTNVIVQSRIYVSDPSSQKIRIPESSEEIPVEGTIPGNICLSRNTLYVPTKNGAAAIDLTTRQVRNINLNWSDTQILDSGNAVFLISAQTGRVTKL